MINVKTIIKEEIRTFVFERMNMKIYEECKDQFFLLFLLRGEILRWKGVPAMGWVKSI